MEAVKISEDVVKKIAERPHVFQLRQRRGRLELAARPVDAYPKDIAEYVRQHFNECPYAHLKGEEFKKFVKEHGMHPGAWCVKWLMERYKQERGVGRRKKKYYVTKAELAMESLGIKPKEEVVAEEEQPVQEPAPPMSPPSPSPPSPPPPQPSQALTIPTWAADLKPKTRDLVLRILRYL